MYPKGIALGAAYFVADQAYKAYKKSSEEN
jgi:hypothetical protein